MSYNWYESGSAFYVYSTEDDDIIGEDSLSDTYPTRAACVKAAEEKNLKSHGYQDRKIKIFKVNLTFTGEVKIDTGEADHFDRPPRLGEIE